MKVGIEEEGVALVRGALDTMTVRAWISILAAIGELMLAGFALAHRRGSPLKTALSLLCLDIAAWTAASPAHVAWPDVALSIDRVLSPLTAPLALDFVLVFAGIRRSSHLIRFAAFAVCGSLSIASFFASMIPAKRAFLSSDAWSIWLLASSVPTMVVTLATLFRHRRRTADGDERTRATLLVLVFATGTLFGVTDGIGDLVPIFPPLADTGMLISALGMAVVTVRYRLFGTDTARNAMVPLFVGGVVTFVLCSLALHRAGTRAVMLVLVGLAAVVATLAAARGRIIAKTLRAERVRQFLTLGRFAAQMEHDVRNPLAALKGSAQILRRDLASAEPALDRLAFADLVLDQIRRIEVIFERYRRLSRLELHRCAAELNTVVKSVLARQSAAVPAAISVKSALAHDLPPCWADIDLLASVLENLTRNAIEAMAEGGTVTVRTATTPDQGVEISVEDTGAGMDPRTCERATDDFFTTKPTGSGFGLAFAKRVTEAHGGHLTIQSQLGRGTVVKMWIPANSSEGAPSNFISAQFDQERHR